MVFLATEEFSNATWIADSGASTHMGFVDDGMRDVQEIDEPIKVGNGNKARAIKELLQLGLHLHGHILRYNRGAGKLPLILQGQP